jgi:RNA polymerase sigma-70 factor (ECF subfamily)
MLEYDMALAAGVDSDTERIARDLREGNIAVLQSLVEQYQYRLVRYLTYLLGSRDAVDDLVQETWLRVFERGASYDGHSRFEPWLFTIARNLTIDYMRKRRTFSLDSDSGTGEDAAAMQPVSTGPSPFALAARTEDAEQLVHSLETLAPIYREALVLRFQEDLSLQEMAGVLQAPLTTVSSRIHRGLAALRAQFEAREPMKGGGHAS